MSELNNYISSDGSVSLEQSNRDADMVGNILEFFEYLEDQKVVYSTVLSPGKRNSVKSIYGVYYFKY